jgi:hypothetical protein
MLSEAETQTVANCVVKEKIEIDRETEGKYQGGTTPHFASAETFWESHLLKILIFFYFFGTEA